MQLTKTQLAKLVEEMRFARPFRRWNLIKQDADFLDLDYKRVWGTWHRGIDLNGVGGGATDLGMVIQSMFPGHVIEITAQNGWGTVVLVRSLDWVRQLAEHVLGEQLDVLDVQYAHLEQISVSTGMFLNAGEHLGSLGAGDKDLNWRSIFRKYVPHLHMEVRKKAVPAIVHQRTGTKALVLEQCLDPNVLMNSLSFSERGNIIPEGEFFAPARMVDLGSDTYLHGIGKINTIDGKFFARNIL